MTDPCSICLGACCESIVIPWPPSVEGKRWLFYHASRGTDHGAELECRCSKLAAGRCGIYADRPTVCRTYLPGCPACVSAVMRRRDGQQRADVLEALKAKPL